MMRPSQPMHALGLAVALGGLVLLGAAGRPAAEAAPGAARGPLAWMQQAVGLTDQQVEAIRASAGPLREQMWQVRLALGDARGELRAAMAQDPPSPAAIQAAKDKIKALLGQRLDLMVDLRLAVRQHLTPEQRAKLAQLMAERRARWLDQRP